MQIPSNSKTPIIIHIGYPKTGTTTLQSGFFARHPEIHSIGKPHFTADGEFILRCLTQPNISRDELQSAAARCLNRPKAGQVTVLSHEGLAQARYYDVEFGMPLPDRIVQIFGAAKIMIGIRSQVPWLEALYLHKLQPDRYTSFESFARAYRGHELDYHRLASTYIDRLGKENVAVFPLEQLAKTPNEYMARVAQFLSVACRDEDRIPPAKNTRGSRRYQIYSALRSAVPLPKSLRLPPQWARRVESFLQRGRPASARLPNHLRIEIERTSAASNAALARTFNLDLRRLGYPIADAHNSIVPELEIVETVATRPKSFCE